MQEKVRKIKFSIILVTYKRCDLIKICLREISLQLNNRDDWEILLVVNGNDQKTVSHLQKYPWINAFQISATSPAQARNILIKEAKGEYLCFLDDDAMPCKDYFKTAVEFISNYCEVDVFGGPDTVFPDASFFERTVGMAILSPLATATTRLRHKKKDHGLILTGNETKLILCNLWCKRNIFTQEGYLFDKRFFRNEENILLWQLEKAGKDIKYLPFLYVFHRKKRDLKSFISAVVRSGRNRLKGCFLYPKSFNFIYFIPMIFVLYIFGLPLTKGLIPWSLLMAYFVLLIFFTARITVKHKKRLLFLPVFMMQIVINMSYGLAFYIELSSQLRQRMLSNYLLKLYKKRRKVMDTL